MRSIKTISTLFLIACLFGILGTLTAQARPGIPTAYSAATPVLDEKMQVFHDSFDDQDVGFFHVYAKSEVDPQETYLLRGEEMSDLAVQMLPKKYVRMAKRMNAKVYGAGAIRGNDENMYIVRMDGPTNDRIELFAMRANKIVHLKTLATMSKRGNSFKQMDSYITDVDGDSYLDIVQIMRAKDGSIGKTNAYVLDRSDRSWVKTKQLNIPWNSIELYEPADK